MKNSKPEALNLGILHRSSLVNLANLVISLDCNFHPCHVNRWAYTVRNTCEFLKIKKCWMQLKMNNRKLFWRRTDPKSPIPLMTARTRLKACYHHFSDEKPDLERVPLPCWSIWKALSPWVDGLREPKAPREAPFPFPFLIWSGEHLRSLRSQCWGNADVCLGFCFLLWRYFYV